MERDKLRALLERSTEQGSSLQSGAQLQEWLESFADNVKARAWDVKDRVDKLLDHTSSVEQELKNTFNSFRLLSNTQFIENRVYEEDETLVAAEETESQRELRQESYEDDIVPRYREAVHSAWSSHELVSKSDRLRDMKYRRLPFIIGTDEFTRDPYAGLEDPGRSASSSGLQKHDYDSEAEKDGANMAAAMVGKGVLSEAEWTSEQSSDEQDNQEPAVSAALDFKAMLEAALRGTYIHHDDDSLRNDASPTTMHSGSDHGGTRDGVETDVPWVDEDNNDALHDILGKIKLAGERDSLSRSRTEIPNQLTESSSPFSSTRSDDDETQEVNVRPQTSLGGAEDGMENLPPETTEKFELPRTTMQGDTDASSSEAAAEEFRQTSTSESTGFRPKSLFDDNSDHDQPVSFSLPVETAQGHARVPRTNLSSLLFGDDDEDPDELVLFGSVRGHL